MAPNKFEQHIKEELNKREIEPSASAWEKISNGLDESQKQRKPKYFWLGIAASFAGLLIFSTIYFNYDKTDTTNSDTIVDTDKETIEIMKIDEDSSIKNQEENHIANSDNQKSDNIKTRDENFTIKTEITNNNPQKNEITKVATVKKPLEIEISKDDYTQEKLIAQKIAEVVAKVDKLEQNENTLTDLEVDSLILNAQQEILQNKIFRQNQSVDAMALLNEVEDELDKPLKDQLFDLLKKGIYETRNAIADRN